MTKAVLFTDGAAFGNPGPGGIGAVLYDENGEEIDHLSEAIGHSTNNEAEYSAVIRGLELARLHKVTQLVVKLDSLLVKQQLTGVFRIKNRRLIELAREARVLADSFESIEFIHIGRELNDRADGLSKAGAQLDSLS